MPDIKQIVNKLNPGVSIVVILLIAMVMAFFPYEPLVLAEKNIQSAIQTKNALELALNNSKPEAQTLPDYRGRLQSNWEQKLALERAPNAWAWYLREDFRFRIAAPPADRWINLPDDLTIESMAVVSAPFRLTLLGVEADTAILKLSKRENGKWFSGICHVKKGNKINFSAGMLGSKRVNWDPGWTLIDVNPREEITRHRWICGILLDKNGKAMWDAQGRLIHTGKKVITKEFCAVIEYQDEKGKKIRLWQSEDLTGRFTLWPERP